MAKTEIWPKKRKPTQEPASCVLCKKPIVAGEDYHFLKLRRRPPQFFHASCYQEVRKV